MTHSKSLRRNRKAASPAVSMVIITAATIVLVLVSGGYALQVLEREQRAAEFETAQNSILAFDDAVRDIAWDRDGSRSVRFTNSYGSIRLLPSTKSFTIYAPGFTYSNNTAAVKYYMPSSQLSLGTEAPFYILGDNHTVVSKLTESFGQASVKPESGYACISLNYRVRVSIEGPATYINSLSAWVNYVDIILIRLDCDDLSIGSGGFDLVARNVGITTYSSPICTVGEDGGKISVVSNDLTDDQTPEISLGLDPNAKVIFNVIIASVRVSP